MLEPPLPEHPIVNKKLIIRIFTPAILITYLILNYFTLSKIESHLRSAIAKNEALSLDFVTKNVLSNTLEAQVRWQDTPEGTPLLVYLSPSYFSQSANYRLKINDVSPLLNNHRLKVTPYWDEADNILPTELSIDGTYYFLSKNSTTNIHKLNIRNSEGPELTADKATISLHHDDQHTPELITFFEVYGLNLFWVTLDYFKYDSRGTTLDTLNIKSIAKDIHVSDDGVEIFRLITKLPSTAKTTLQRLKIFPASYDFSLRTDQRLAKFLLGEPQDIDSDLHAKGHFLLSSPLMINETFLTGSILPQETDFLANLQFKSESKISDIGNFDRFRALSKALPQTAGIGVGLLMDDASPSKVNIDSDITAHILSSGTPISLEGHYKEDRFYPNNILKYTYVTLKPADLRQLAKGLYVSVNGQFIGPKPEATALIAQIKTNNLLYIRSLLPSNLLPILAALPTQHTKQDHIIEVHMPSGG